MTDDEIFPASDDDKRLDLLAESWERRLDDYLADAPDDIPFPEDQPAKPRLLPLVDMADWNGEPPPRRSLWGDWLPVHQTTMLTGPGGVGKSLFEQCLCTAIALGKPFLGMNTTQRNTLYITCEDDAEELWRRQYAINAMFGVDRDDVRTRLQLCALTGEEGTALAVEGERGTLETTDRWQQLLETCSAHDIGLYAFDNATDAMAGDHNDLHQVASFINLLTGLAIKRDGVAMIIHHPNKAGDDWLGSVAYHNKVRSRLIIGRGDDDMDADARTIENPKANYGPSGGRIDFRWYQGAFVTADELPADYSKELADSIRVQGENSAFLACLRARMAVPGREVGASIGPNYAPARFAEMTESRGISKTKLARAMERLFHIGAITTKEVKREGKGGTKTIIVEASPNSPEPAPEPVPNYSPEPPRTRPEQPRAHTLIDKSITGGAARPAPPADEEGASDE